MSFGVIYDLDFNQINPKVLASDVVGESYPTFPTTSTGTNLGNYNHLGIDGQNNNKWDFLNISGILQGGFNWWNSNSTQAPLLLGTLDSVGLTIDRSTSSSSLDPLPTITNSGPTFAITQTPINGPPWNIVGYGTPIQVLHNTAYLTVGTIYYAAGLNSQTIQIATNPDGSGILDTSDLSSAQQPILATLSGAPIITTKTSILTSEGLFLKTDPNFAPTVLSNTGLSISDLTNNNVTINPTIITVMDSSSYNTQLTATTLNINGNAKTTVLNEDNMTITDASNNNSILSATNLSISNSIVSTNINNFSVSINDGITTSLLNSTNLTFNGRSYAQNQVIPTLIYSSPAIYADGSAPATSLSIRNTYGYNGWYFKNVVASSKINWYFAPNRTTTTQVSDLKGIVCSFHNGLTTSNDNTLFFTVYTIPTGNNDYAPGFFHSSMTYVFNQTITPIANANYQGVAIINKSFIPFNYETQIQYEPSTVNNPKGTYSQTDNILAIVIGTNSTSPTNSVEFVVNKLNIVYMDNTQSYLLVPP
jgi:hypothetical protein